MNWKALGQAAVRSENHTLPVTQKTQLSITPGKHLEGEFSGTITVTATDNDGNPAEISLPVALSVEKPVQYDESSMQAVQEEQTNPIVLYALAAGCVILLITCIVQGAVLRKKIREPEEDKL